MTYKDKASYGSWPPCRCKLRSPQLHQPLLLLTWHAQTLLLSMCDIYKPPHSAPFSCKNSAPPNYTNSAPLNVTCTNSAALNVWRIQNSALCSIFLYKLCSSQRDMYKHSCSQCVTYTDLYSLLHSNIQTLLLSTWQAQTVQLSMCDVYKPQPLDYANSAPLNATMQTLLLSMCDVYELSSSQRDMHKLCCFQCVTYTICDVYKPLLSAPLNNTNSALLNVTYKNSAILNVWCIQTLLLSTWLVQGGEDS